MPETWLNVETVTDLTGWSERTVQLKAKDGELRWRSGQQRSANGRKAREYALSSLPPDAQVAFVDRRAQKSAGELESPEKNQLVLFSPRSAAVDAPRMPVSEEHREQVKERMAILAPLIEYLRLPTKESKRSWLAPDGRPVRNSDDLAQRIGEEGGIGRATVWSWYRTYEREGSGALFRRAPRDKGKSRWFAQHRDAALLAAWYFLECRQSIRACYDVIRQERDALRLADDEVPSYETVRAWLQSAPPHLKAYALEGRRAYQERFAPYLRRHYSDVAPNEIWVSDHMIHDVEVANDCFPELEWGAPMRLRFTCLLDFRSRYVVGWSWSPEGSSRSIATALRRAIERWGICSHFYCDNGKDYLKVARGAVPAYLSEPAEIRGWHETELREIENAGVLARLGVKITHCIVRHPQSKHVERFFRTLHEQFDKRFYQHYTGGAPHLRPDATAAAMEIHRKLMKRGQVQRTTHPPASFFINACMYWIEAEYHQRPHGGEGMEGLSPFAMFDNRQNKVRPIDDSALALLLAERATRKVRECAVELSIFKKQPRRYTHAAGDAAARDILHELTDQSVTVAYDQLDPERVAILHEDGRFLCWAPAEEMIGFDPADKSIQRRIADSMADRRRMEKATRTTLAEISRAAHRRGFRNPMERAAEAMQIPAAVGGVLTHRPPKAAPETAAYAGPPTPGRAARALLEGLRK